jgi:phosphatidylglycerophosphate synthase
METNKPTIVNHGLKYGLILGFIQIAIMLLLYIVDKALMVKWWIAIVSLVLLIVMLVMAVKSYKKQQNNTINFKDAFVLTLIVGVSALILNLIFNYLLYNVIDPSLPEFIKQKAIENTMSMMEKFGADENAMNKALEQLETQDFSQGPSKLGMQLIWGVVFDAIFALIIAAIMRTKQKPVDDIQ